MDNDQKLQLQGLINEHNVSDQTELIRKIKHSEQLRIDIDILIQIKKENTSENIIKSKGQQQCPLLHKYYTDIFNRIINDELSVNLMYKFLSILKRIEDDEMDQHNASFQVGTILKEMYIDSAIKREEKAKTLDDANDNNDTIDENKVYTNTKNITWAQWKKINKKQKNKKQKTK